MHEKGFCTYLNQFPFSPKKSQTFCCIFKVVIKLRAEIARRGTYSMPLNRVSLISSSNFTKMNTTKWLLSFDYFQFWVEISVLEFPGSYWCILQMCFLFRTIRSELHLFYVFESFKNRMVMERLSCTFHQWFLCMLLTRILSSMDLTTMCKVETFLSGWFSAKGVKYLFCDLWVTPRFYCTLYGFLCNVWLVQKNLIVQIVSI